MANIIRQTTELAMHIVRAYVGPGDVVVDATCGNGKDTLALAAMDPARLYAFDVQDEALQETIRLLKENGFGERLTQSGKGSLADYRIVVEQLSHENLREFFENHLSIDGDKPDSPEVSGFIKVVVFNLGYLPGGDKTVTTKAGATLAAVEAAMDLLTADGLICITMYSGHPEGKEEKEVLLKFAEGLDSTNWHCAYISMPNQKNDPPEILLITRKK